MNLTYKQENHMLEFMKWWIWQVNTKTPAFHDSWYIYTSIVQSLHKGSPFMLMCLEGDGDKVKGPKGVYESVQQSP